MSRLQVVVDGRDVTDLQTGLSTSNVDPGGFEACSFTLPDAVEPPRKGARLEVRLGLERQWRGRVGETGRDITPPRGRIAVAGEGMVAALRDTSVRMVFIDRELGRWTPPSAQRQLALFAGWNLNSGFRVGRDDSGRPGLLAEFANPPFVKPLVEAYYDAGVGNRVARIRFGQALLGLSSADTAVGSNLYMCDTDAAGGVSPGTDIKALTSVDVATFLQRYVLLQLMYNWPAEAGVQGATYGAQWTNLSVIGDHGLPLRGGDYRADGFWPSDIVRYVLDRQGTIAPGVIVDASDYVVMHSVYRERVAREAVIREQGALAGFHWGVWEPLSNLDDRDRLDFRPYPAPTSPTCWVSSADCERLNLPERLQSFYNVARVRYDDIHTGTRQELTVTTAVPELALVGTRELLLDMGPGRASSARVWGQLQLELANRAGRASGSAVLPELVRLPGGGSKPACLLRAGRDRLLITDLPGRSPLGDNEASSYRVVRVDMTTDEKGRERVRVDLDWGLNLLEVLAARLAVATAVAQGR